MERMHYILVLFDVQFVVLDEDNGALVLVLAAVVRRAEDRDDRGESLMATPSVHLVAVDLDLMSSDHRYEIVRAQNLLHWIEAELDGALALRVGAESHLSCITVVHGVRPEQVTEEA